MKIFPYPLNLNLRHTFQIARGAHNVQNNVVIVITDTDGVSGYGEAAPTRFFGEDIPSVIKTFALAGEFLKDFDPFQTDAIALGLKNLFPKDSSARAAVDMAIHDIVSKKLKIPLFKLLGLSRPELCITSFTIGIDTLEKMCEKVDEVKDFPILKIKVGTKDDIELLKELRKITRAVFRVDANTGWTVDEAIKKINAMEELGVEFIEQPFPVGSMEALKKVKRHTKLPIILDEDVKDSQDIPALAGIADGINLKLMKCGGIREALRMIHTARAHGLKVMIGCNIESSVSITAAAHLTSLVDYIDLDGNLLVSNDPYLGVTVDKGRLLMPEGEGLGIVPNAARQQPEETEPFPVLAKR